MAERRFPGDQREAQLLGLAAGDVDGLARRWIAGGDRTDDVVASGHPQRPGERRARRIDAVDLDLRRHVGVDGQEGDEGPLLGPHALGLLALLGPELGVALEQGVERVDRVDRALELGVDEADVEQRRRIAGQLVGPLELDERARVLPLVEEAHAAVEALGGLLAGLGGKRRRLGTRPSRPERQHDCSDGDNESETHHCLRNGFSSMSPCSSARVRLTGAG